MPAYIERRTFLVMTAAFCLSGVRANAAEDLTGLWSAETRSRGGLGQQFTFTPNEVISTFGALLDLKYDIEGNMFRMIVPNAEQQLSPELQAGQPFSIEGDRLTIAQGATAPPLVMTRVGAPHAGVHLIVGDWTYQHPTGAPAVQRFSSTGAMQLAVPMQTKKGPYRIGDETLTMQLESMPDVAVMIKRAGNVLFMTDAKGVRRQYLKFEY